MKPTTNDTNVKNSIQRQAFLALVFLLSLGINTTGQAAAESIVTVKVEGDYTDVFENVRSAIVGKGINISNIVPASQMLHRTGADFGYSDEVYVQAESLEFCSARLSHKLARKHPDNIVLCPFIISVYVVSDEPDIVRISYRIPSGKPGSEAVIGEIVELIDSIIEDATW
jgi:uncharacterized protein (DUF302 family)